MTAIAAIANPRVFGALCSLWQDTQHETWLTLRGGSMAPAIEDGSRILLQFRREPPSVGQIGAFRRGNSLVVHRLVEVRAGAAGDFLVFRGDANPDSDPPVAPDALVGVVIAVRHPSLWRRANRLIARGRRWGAGWKKWLSSRDAEAAASNRAAGAVDR